MLKTIRTCCLMLLFGAVGMIALPYAAQAQSQTEQSIHELKAFVDQGITYIKEHGTEAAYKEFSDQKGQFKKKNLYLFVVTYKGLTVAHGADPKKLVGKNVYDLRDEFGTPFIQMFIDMAKRGGGVVGYYWPKPGTDIVQFKTSYIKPIPGVNAFIGAGFYSE